VVPPTFGTFGRGPTGLKRPTLGRKDPRAVIRTRSPSSREPAYLLMISHLDIACDGYSAIPASISGIAGQVTMVHPSRYRCLSWVIPSPTKVQVRDTLRGCPKQ